MTNFWHNSVILSILISAVSSAEIAHKLRHHKGHHKIEKSQSQVNDFKESNIPLKILALLAANSMANRNDTDDVITTVHKPMDIDFDGASRETVNCPGCIHAKNFDEISDDELDELRIEFVKNEILRKLRLTERPPKKEKLINELPEPVQEDHMDHGYEKSVKNVILNNEDYYAKTTQKIVFLTQENDKCKQYGLSSYQPAICFSLLLPSDVEITSIETAQLWVFKKQNELKHAMNHTLLLSEVNSTSNYLTPISYMQTDTNNHDWEKMDIETFVKVKIENRQLSHLIRLTCDNCKNDELPITLHHDFKPFIVIQTKPQKSTTRRKRSIECSPGTNECCRDSLYIDFAAIGWDDWILSPKGYHAYFCHGTCNNVASITRVKTEHGAVFNRLMHSSRDNKKKLEMIPCCTGTSYSALEIIRLDNNNTAAKEELPNMILESCGCS